jgi:hypothetical protein
MKASLRRLSCTLCRERHRATAAALAGYHEAEGEGSTLDGVKVREALEKWNAGPAA